MTRKLTLVLAGLLATGLLAAGCGDDDDDESSDTGTTTVALTKAEWIKQADEICTKGNQELDQAGQQQFGNSNQPPSQAEQEQFATDEVIPSIQGQVDDVRALGTPEGDNGEVEEFLASAEADLDKAKQDPSLLTEGSEQDPFAETNQLGKELGLKVCAQG